VITVLDNCKINSRCVWNCHQSLIILTEYNHVHLLWVLGHKGIEYSEIADQLARRGLLHPFISPEPICGISDRVAGWTIRDCMCREHQEYWQVIQGQRNAKSSLSKVSVKRTVDSTYSK
jgi:hypothetical protein